MNFKIEGISVENKIRHVVVKQSLNSHLFMDICYDWGQKPEEEKFEYSGYLGNNVTVSVDDEGNEQSFEGIINGITYFHNRFCLKCVSVSYLMSKTPVNRVFTNKSLMDIVNDIADKYGAECDTSCFPDEVITFDSIVQFQETDFDFLKRLACLSGCIILSEGWNLFFGRNFPDEKNVELSPKDDWGSSEGSISLELNPASAAGVPFGYKNYKEDIFSDKNNLIEEDLKSSPSSSVLNDIIDLSGDLYKDISFEISDYGSSDKSEFEGYLHSRLSSQHGRMYNISGICQSPILKTGFRIKYKSHAILAENYTISGINIHCSYDKYTNNYEAMPEEAIISPSIDNTKLNSLTQYAIVIDNVDKEGLGRVKVRFPWDFESSEDNCFWARVVNKASGKKHRTFFTPKIGDEVLLTFEKGDTTKPVVLGSLINDKIKPEFEDGEGYGSNEILLAQTDNGTKVHVLDTEDKQEFKIEMKGTGSDNKHTFKLTIDKNSPDPVVFLKTEGEIKIQASKDINIGTDENIKISAQKDIEIKCKNMKISSQNESKVKAGSNMKIEAGGKMDVKSGTMMVMKSGLIKLN